MQLFVVGSAHNSATWGEASPVTLMTIHRWSGYVDDNSDIAGRCSSPDSIESSPVDMRVLEDRHVTSRPRHLNVTPVRKPYAHDRTGGAPIYHREAVTRRRARHCMRRSSPSPLAGVRGQGGSRRPRAYP